MRNKNIILTVLFTMAFLFTFSLSYAESDQNKTSTESIFEKVLEINQTLEKIRIAMGKEPFTKYGFNTSNANLNNLYDISITLFNKTNRLAFEVGNPVENFYIDDTTNPNLKEISKLINKSLEQIIAAGKTLRVQFLTPSPPLQKKDISLNDLFQALLNTNKKINSLFYNQYSPGDVYQNITIAIYYISDLLEKFPDSQSTPTEIKFIENKTPENVFNRLLKCLEIINQIMEKFNFKSIQVNLDQTKHTELTPSDVYDLSSIIVSELKYLLDLTSNKERKFTYSYFPGYKTPSDVFQRSGVLIEQLIELKKQVELHPHILHTNKQ